ncbi:MAG: hypothetical protein WCJ29_04080 [bacterium]
MKRILSKLFPQTLIVFLFSLLVPASALAVSWTDPLKGLTLQEAMGSIIRNAIGYVGILGLLGFLWGGFKWMIAGGEAKKVQQAKDVMIWTVVGMAVVFISYAAVTFVMKTLTTVAGIK